MNLSKRIERIESRNGFKSEQEWREYLAYARKIDPEVKAEQIQTPEDYLSLLSSAFPPLPEQR